MLRALVISVLLLVLDIAGAAADCGRLTDISCANEADRTCVLVDGKEQCSLWIQVGLQSPKPKARYGHTAVSINDSHMLVFGGLHPSASEVVLLNDLWSYCYATDEWTLLEPSGQGPRPRAYHTAVYHAGFGGMVVFGGMGYDGSQSPAYQDMFVYRSDKNAWEEIKPTHGRPWPAPRFYHTVAVLDNVMWVYGGRSASSGDGDDRGFSYMEFLWKYDWHKGWSPHRDVKNAPPANVRSALVVMDDHVYAFGNGTLHRLHIHGVDDTPIKWTAEQMKSPMPALAGYSVTPVTPEHVFLFGGLGTAKQGYVKGDWAYDFTQAKWAALPALGDHLPEPRMGHTAVWAKHQVYVYGGKSERLKTIDDVAYLSKRAFASLWRFDGLVDDVSSICKGIKHHDLDNLDDFGDNEVEMDMELIDEEDPEAEDEDDLYDIELWEEDDDLHEADGAEEDISHAIDAIIQHDAVVEVDEGEEDGEDIDEPPNDDSEEEDDDDPLDGLDDEPSPSPVASAPQQDGGAVGEKQGTAEPEPERNDAHSSVALNGDAEDMYGEDDQMTFGTFLMGILVLGALCSLGGTVLWKQRGGVHNKTSNRNVYDPLDNVFDEESPHWE